MRWCSVAGDLREGKLTDETAKTARGQLGRDKNKKKEQPLQPDKGTAYTHTDTSEPRAAPGPAVGNGAAAALTSYSLM
jgi:hypothetical protein